MKLWSQENIQIEKVKVAATAEWKGQQSAGWPTTATFGDEDMIIAHRLMYKLVNKWCFHSMRTKTPAGREQETSMYRQNKTVGAN